MIRLVPKIQVRLAALLSVCGNNPRIGGAGIRQGFLVLSVGSMLYRQNGFMAIGYRQKRRGVALIEAGLVWGTGWVSGGEGVRSWRAIEPEGGQELAKVLSSRGWLQGVRSGRLVEGGLTTRGVGRQGRS